MQGNMINVDTFYEFEDISKRLILKCSGLTCGDDNISIKHNILRMERFNVA